MGDSTAYNVSFTVAPSDTTAITFHPTGIPVDSLPAGDIVVVAWQTQVSQNVSDGTVIPITTSTTWTGSTTPNTDVYSLVLNAPDISFDIAVGDGNILPGTTDTLLALLVNNGHATLNSCRLMLSSPTQLLTVGTGTADSSSLFSLTPGDDVLLTFPVHADSQLPTSIEVPLTLTLTQSSDNAVYPLYIGSNPLETFEGGVYHTSGWTQGYYPWTINMYGAYAGIYCLRSAPRPTASDSTTGCRPKPTTTSSISISTIPTSSPSRA